MNFRRLAGLKFESAKGGLSQSSNSEWRVQDIGQAARWGMLQGFGEDRIIRDRLEPALHLKTPGQASCKVGRCAGGQLGKNRGQDPA